MCLTKIGPWMNKKIDVSQKINFYKHKIHTPESLEVKTFPKILVISSPAALVPGIIEIAEPAIEETPLEELVCRLKIWKKLCIQF